MPNKPKYIRVRDRRQKHQFSIHNQIIDEWLPIIGTRGYTLYSLYVRMANAATEGCYPSYSMISAHLGISRSTISDHNRLLTWCRLLYIEPGNQRVSNDYYILDIPRVTVELLDQIRRKASEADPPLRLDVIRRAATWRPIQDLWQTRKKPKPEILRPGQMSLPLEPLSSTPGEHSGTPGELSGTPGEHRSTVAVPEQSEATIQSKQSNNNNIVGVVDGWDIANKFNPEQMNAFNDLLRCAVQPQAAAELVKENSHQLGRIQLWIDYTEHLILREEQDIRNPAGFIIAGLRSSEAALLPTGEYRYDKGRT